MPPRHARRTSFDHPVRRVARLLAAVVALASIVAAGPQVEAGAAADASLPSAFTPVTPCRLLDTREPPGQPLGGDGTVAVDVAGACGVAAGTVAVAITLTAVRPDAAGYLSAYPTGTAAPTASNLNYRAGQVVANGALIRLGDDGSITIRSLVRTHVVVDVTGYFTPAPVGVAAGRFVPVDATRLVDTRTTGRPGAGSAVVVDAGVPDDAVAVAVNVTTTATAGPDVFTAYARGDDRPTASILNVDGPRQTRSASAIVPVTAGSFEVYTLAGSHVIVDLVGWFTGDSADVATDGLFVATAPTRLVDTREPAGPAGGPRLWDGGSRRFTTDGYTGSPASALAVNVTMVRTEDAGHVVLHPAGSAVPPTSNVNTSSAQNTVANLAIVRVSTGGVTATSLDATHLVIDASGWFTGTPVPAGGVAAVNVPPPARRVVIIADSALAGMRWNGALAGLQGMTPVTLLESCRRLVAPSCRGREGYAPRTVVSELLALGGAGPEDIVVIGAGYDDWHTRFASDFDTVVATARALGYHHIVWPTYLSGVGYHLPGGGVSNYEVMNAVLRSKVASGAYPEVRIWDFDTYSDTATGWFSSDGIHETRLGSFGVADWISRHVAAFDDKPCPQPWVPAGPVDDPCRDPDTEVVRRGALPDIAGLYGV